MDPVTALITVLVFAAGIACGIAMERKRSNAAYACERRLELRPMIVLSDTDAANLRQQYPHRPTSDLH